MPILKAIFLPSGYPSTTPPEYSAFQSWNLLQDFCSYLRGIMATRAILEGMGVGRADATAVQATIQWIFRDGASMLGGLLFTSLSSSNFGQNVKQWRLFADTINNVGITLDMIAPLFREQFLAIVCVASVFKALCGVAAGATGVAIAEHWGEQNGNIADVLAKNGAQHTLVSILGLLFTVQFARFATSSARLTWALYSVLTAVHMGANYAAMRVLALRTLNRARYALLL
ncbi:root UVB sensitive family, partial [Ochromonadaceae sp. CCMP2298]